MKNAKNALKIKENDAEIKLDGKTPTYYE